MINAICEWGEVKVVLDTSSRGMTFFEGLESWGFSKVRGNLITTLRSQSEVLRYLHI